VRGGVGRCGSGVHNADFRAVPKTLKWLHRMLLPQGYSSKTYAEVKRQNHFGVSISVEFSFTTAAN